MVMLIKEAQNNWLLELFGAGPSSGMREFWHQRLKVEIGKELGEVFLFVNAVLVG